MIDSKTQDHPSVSQSFDGSSVLYDALLDIVIHTINATTSSGHRSTDVAFARCPMDLLFPFVIGDLSFITEISDSLKHQKSVLLYMHNRFRPLHNSVIQYGRVCSYSSQSSDVCKEDHSNRQLKGTKD